MNSYSLCGGFGRPKIGIDLAEIDRFRDPKRRERLLERAFTEREREYFKKKKDPSESVAAAFAAKEAFSKLLGTGVRGFAMKDIEVVRDGLGKPELYFKGVPAPVSLSLTHTRVTAAAVVVGAARRAADEVFSESETLAETAALLPEFRRSRKSDINKGDCGKVLIIAGSKGMTGAACMCAMGALRTGSGIVTLALPDSEQPIAAIKLNEPLTVPLPSENGVISEKAVEALGGHIKKADVCAIGPGLSVSAGTKAVLKTLLELPDGKILIDADGLNAIAADAGLRDALKRSAADITITPHPGEMARLMRTDIPTVQSDRVKSAVDFAREYGITVVLKGENTVVASPEGEYYINPTGNPGMATGGSGDVLAGAIGSLLGQGLDGFAAARVGVFVHGLAGDMAAAERGVCGTLAGDIAERLGNAMELLMRRSAFRE